MLRKSDNETYQEGAFHDPDKLMASGHIYQVDADGKAINPKDAPAAPAEESNDDPGSSALAAAAAAATGDPGADQGAGDESPIAGKTKEDFLKKELQELCDAVEGIEYDDSDTKADLFEMLEGHYGQANA